MCHCHIKGSGWRHFVNGIAGKFPATQTPKVVGPNVNLNMEAFASEPNQDVSNFVGNLPMSTRMKILNSVDMT